MTKIITIEQPECYKRVLKSLLAGEIIAYPTETFYGLGGNALKEKCVKKIFALKDRYYNKPVPILVRDMKMLRRVIEEIPSLAFKLMEAFWPGPLTIVMKASKEIPPLLTGYSGKIGVRISSNPIAKALIEGIDFPLTASSANLSGHKSPTTVQEVLEYLNGKIPLAVDGGKLMGKKGSTVLELDERTFKVIREGEIKQEEIERLLLGCRP